MGFEPTIPVSAWPKAHTLIFRTVAVQNLNFVNNHKAPLNFSDDELEKAFCLVSE
jgi:hypothetical protein